MSAVDDLLLEEGAGLLTGHALLSQSSQNFLQVCFVVGDCFLLGRSTGSDNYVININVGAGVCSEDPFHHPLELGSGILQPHNLTGPLHGFAIGRTHAGYVPVLLLHGLLMETVHQIQCRPYSVSRLFDEYVMNQRERVTVLDCFRVLRSQVPGRDDIRQASS